MKYLKTFCIIRREDGTINGFNSGYEVTKLKNERRNEVNAVESRIREEEAAKHTIKDSVFTDLFQDKKYLIQLYKTLHPEDTEVTEDELSDITIHNIMTDGIYNDLGFRRGKRLLILVEAQATWTENIILRSLMYLMTTYQDYFRKTNQNIYKSKKVTFPKPELYVIFTGEREEHPEYMYLSKEYFDGEESFLDVRVRVLYGSDKDDIISQYVTFAKVYDEQRKKYGKTRTTVLETIRVCKDKNILTEYLSEREKEVEAIMLAMYDEEEILLDYIRNEKYEAAKETAVKMLKMGKLSNEEIVQCVPSLTLEDVESIQRELLQRV